MFWAFHSGRSISHNTIGLIEILKRFASRRCFPSVGHEDDTWVTVFHESTYCKLDRQTIPMKRRHRLSPFHEKNPMLAKEDRSRPDVTLVPISLQRWTFHSNSFEIHNFSPSDDDDNDMPVCRWVEVETFYGSVTPYRDVERPRDTAIDHIVSLSLDQCQIEQSTRFHPNRCDGMKQMTEESWM